MTTTLYAAGSSGEATPIGPAGGDLSGTYPNPSVVNIQSLPVYNAADTASGGSISIGPGALTGQTSPAAYDNTAIGYQALHGTMTTGATANTAIGYQAGTKVTSGTSNTLVGSFAGANSLTSGQYNVFVGRQAGYASNGSFCMAVGASALNNASGSGNVGMGYSAGQNCGSGGNNTYVGYATNQNGSSQVTGSNNTFIGAQAGLIVAGAAANNTIIGANVGSLTLTTGSSNILIGTSNAVDAPAGSTSNYLNIGNAITGTAIGSAPILTLATATTLKTTGTIAAFTAQSAADIPIFVQLASSQSGNAFQILPNGSSTPISRFTKDGYLRIANTVADTALSTDTQVGGGSSTPIFLIRNFATDRVSVDPYGGLYLGDNSSLNFPSFNVGFGSAGNGNVYSSVNFPNNLGDKIYLYNNFGASRWGFGIQNWKFAMFMDAGNPGTGRFSWCNTPATTPGTANASNGTEVMNLYTTGQMDQILNADYKGHTIKLTNGHTASAFEIQDYLSNVLTAFGPTGKVTKYDSIATVGKGVPAIYGVGRSTAQTAAVASVAAYTVGSADGSFYISANVNVTTSTAHSFTVTCAYTDETNTSRTLTLNFSQLAGGFVTAITNVTGAGPYEGVPVQIRCKAGTTITIASTGTFTTVTYNIEGAISQLT